jgi:hypothetical protein
MAELPDDEGLALVPPKSPPYSAEEGGGGDIDTEGFLSVPQLLGIAVFWAGYFLFWCTRPYGTVHL